MDLKLEESGIALDDRLLPEHLTENPSVRTATHYYPGGMVVKLAIQRIAGATLHVSVTFEDHGRVVADLFLPTPHDGKSWADWSTETEMARKAEQERWIESLGLRFAPVDERFLFLPEWERPRRAPAPAGSHWKEICSFYDSKGGSVGMRVVIAGRAED